MKRLAPKVTLLSMALFSGLVSAEQPNTPTVNAFFGDPSSQVVTVVNLNNMTQEASIPTAAIPYPVDRAGALDKVYVMTRGSSSIDIIDPATLNNVGSIYLPHKPRSGEAYNEKLAVQLIAGGDKPMTSIIDPFNDTVITTVGKDITTIPNGDFGGSLASGHPYWFSKRKFAVIDRANRTIQLYRLRGDRQSGFKAKLLDEVSTPTSVHHIVARDRSKLKNKDRFIYYAVAEGSPNNGVAPKILELKVKGNKIKLKRSVDLTGDNVYLMGAHHADLHPDGVHIYVGSTEGHIFVINRHSLQIVKVIETGLGSGHTKFIPSKNLAVITNHKATFVSLIDTSTHSKITDIEVSPPQSNGQILQSHSSFVDSASENFYAFATDSGTFYELNLDNYTISRTVYTGGTPTQGMFLSLSDED